MKLITAGRTDIDVYFEQSGVLGRGPAKGLVLGMKGGAKLNHTPFLVFRQDGENVAVDIVDQALNLLSYPDDTPVMGQWSGNWRSDFFQFTVGDARRHLEAKP